MIAIDGFETVEDVFEVVGERVGDVMLVCDGVYAFYVGFGGEFVSELDEEGFCVTGEYVDMVNTDFIIGVV